MSMTSVRCSLILSVALICAASQARAQTNGSDANSTAKAADPRVGLGAGWNDAQEAARNLTLVAHGARPAGWFNPVKMGDINFWNSDLAFSGNLVFQGGWNGFQVWDISNPRSPKLRTTFVCPGGQGDPSVYGNLLFISVEETRGRVDCGTQGVADTVSADRFRGVRIFDISDIDHPKQVAAVQTCRGSHTHTLVPDPKDTANLYVYVSGTSSVRRSAELAGCSDKTPLEDPNTSLFRIDVIKVPLAAPQNAKIVTSPRVFADSTGAIAGLWKGGTHGPGTQETSETSRCHDITVYPEIGLAAGACSGNGILLDIRDPANPKRVDEVSDPNFAFWHSATFNNDGTKVLFTDEWGGGTQPRCLATDRPEWGADAIYTLTNGKMRHAGFYKLPAPQTLTENCVAHNGSLIPVPGRDIMAQGWYQGGVSVFDFTDAAHPVEIAFFDRGPMSATELEVAGDWLAYWYNGHIFASEMGRGLDLFELEPSEFLTKNEIDAAKLVHLDRFNAQDQSRIVWPPSFVVARAYVDGLARTDGLRRTWASGVTRDLAQAERLKGQARRAALTKLATQLDRDARGVDASRVQALAAVVRKIR
jgi:hypothetical protein